MRWTVDTKEDLDFVRQVYSYLKKREDFSWLDVLELMKNRPKLAEINRGVTHRSYLDVDNQNLNK
jgi:spore coat polysaccharide biosynthesis protein SpsF (cytidylyltransferase family)